MARKKIGGAVVPYSGKLVSTKGKLVHKPRSEGINNLGGIGKRGHARAKFRQDSKYAARRFRASAGAFRARSMHFGDRFFRYFTMFLVCLVLFAAVTGSEYGLYKDVVNILYETTELVGGVAMVTARGLVKAVGIVDDFYETPQYTGTGTLKLKIKGDYYSFGVDETSWSYGLSYSYYTVVSCPSGYENWEGDVIVKIFKWYLCPDGATRKGTYTEVE